MRHVNARTRMNLRRRFGIAGASVLCGFLVMLAWSQAVPTSVDSPETGGHASTTPTDGSMSADGAEVDSGTQVAFGTLSDLVIEPDSARILGFSGLVLLVAVAVIVVGRHRFRSRLK